MVDEARANELKEQSRDWKSWDLTARQVCDLELDFLHGGVPLPTLVARWSPPVGDGDGGAAQALLELDATRALLDLMRGPNLAANDDRARHYDHEVKGLSVVKPLIGERGDVASTATVMRVRHGRDEGVILGEGIHPYYSDYDTDAMARARSIAF